MQSAKKTAIQNVYIFLIIDIKIHYWFKEKKKLQMMQMIKHETIKIMKNNQTEKKIDMFKELINMIKQK
jgi:hypothetical protein